MKKSLLHSMLLGAALVAVPAAHSASIEPGAGQPEGPQAPGAMAVSADSVEVSRLLREAQGMARELRRETQEMEAFGLSAITWDSYTAKISAIRGHVNEIGGVIEKLQRHRPLA